MSESSGLDVSLQFLGYGINHRELPLFDLIQTFVGNKIVQILMEKMILTFQPSLTNFK